MKEIGYFADLIKRNPEYEAMQKWIQKYDNQKVYKYVTLRLVNEGYWARHYITYSIDGVRHKECLGLQVSYKMTRDEREKNHDLAMLKAMEREMEIIKTNLGNTRRCDQVWSFPKEGPKKKTYIIEDKGNGLFKIGRSVCPEKRLKEIKTGNPKASLIAICSKDIEKELHKKYEMQRKHLEWFDLSAGQLRSIINRYGFDKYDAAI